MAALAAPIGTVYQFGAARMAELSFRTVDVVLGVLRTHFYHGLRAFFHRALAALAAIL